MLKKKKKDLEGSQLKNTTDFKDSQCECGSSQQKGEAVKCFTYPI